MKICMLSSYPPSIHGLATYSAKLCEAMLSLNKNLKILVVSDEHLDSHLSARLEVVKGWQRGSFLYPAKTLRIVLGWRPQLVHCQHEYWLYGRSAHSVTFPILLLGLRIFNKPIVITMHHIISKDELTTEFFARHNLPGGSPFLKKLYVLLYTKMLGILATRIVTHSQTARMSLVNDYGIEESKTVVIPHGADIVSRADAILQSDAKTKLGLMNVSVILAFGQIRRGKGIEYLIDALPKVLAFHPQIMLVVAGMFSSKISPESTGYLEELRSLTKAMRLEDKIAFRTDVPDADIPLYFAAADAIILPYIEDGLLAASGPLSLAIGYGKPVVASEIMRFKDVLRNGENSILVPPRDSSSLAEAINVILENSQLADKLSRGLALLGGSTSWKTVAAKTVTLYKELATRESSNDQSDLARG